MSKKKVEKELEVKTYEEWAKELYENEGIEILDPDGFDRSNPNFMKEKYTKEEFEKGLMRSTIEQTKETKETNTVAEMFRSIVGEHPIEEKYLNGRVFINIKKLKCDYTTYKEERTKYNMPVEEVCSKCGKSFKAGEEIYTAFEEGKQGSFIICGNCAKGE